MKISIRQGVFETNSSSVHTLTIVEQDIMDQWANGKLVYDGWNEKFVSSDLEAVKKYYRYKQILDGDIEVSDEEFEEAENEFDDLDCQYVTWEEFESGDWGNEYSETYHETYTTKHGDVVHVFGYYGNNY